MPSFKTKLWNKSVSPGAAGPTGIVVPPEIVAALGTSKKPAVKVTIDGAFTYQSTISMMDGKFMIPVSAERRALAGDIKAGDPIEVSLELDIGPRTVEVPPDLAAALAKNKKAQAAFDKLAFTYRKEHCRAVEDAKKPETRAARIEKIVTSLGHG